jgi:hypothetical protein
MGGLSPMGEWLQETDCGFLVPAASTHHSQAVRGLPLPEKAADLGLLAISPKQGPSAAPFPLALSVSPPLTAMIDQRY